MRSKEIPTAVIELLGGYRVFGSSVSSLLDLARVTREGLPEEAASYLLLLFSGVYIDWYMNESSFWTSPAGATFGPIAAVFSALMVAAREANFFGTGRRLTPAHSDIVIRTATILAQAIDVFGQSRNIVALTWLREPNEELGGQIPFTLLDTFAGTCKVVALLDRVALDA